MNSIGTLVLFAGAFAAAGCHSAPSVARIGIDPAMASCIPPDSVLVAGLNLDQLRASPFYAQAPATIGALASAYADVSSALAAYNGKDVLVVARGRFHAPPAGAVIVAPGLALYGSAQQTAAASAQYKTGHGGAPDLLAQGEAVAHGAQVWIAARGNAPLPLTGNAANMMRILRKARFLTLTARTGAVLALELRATAPDANAAQAIEETLRADFTLAAAGEARRPDVAAALRTIQVTRDDVQARAALSIGGEAFSRLLSIF
jgi:hypothetical protein